MPAGHALDVVTSSAMASIVLCRELEILAYRDGHLVSAATIWGQQWRRMRPASNNYLYHIEYISSLYWRRGWDSNPRGGFPPTPLAGERLRPLGHLSKAPVTGSAPAGQGAIAERSGPADNGASLAGDTGMGSDWGGALADHMRRIAALRQVEMLLGWDRETQMPPKGSAQRAEQAAAVAEALHALESDPRLADWLAEAGARAAGAAAVNVARGGAGACAGDAGAGAARRRARPRRGRGADRLGRGARGLGLRRLRAGTRADRGAEARGGGLPRRRRRPVRRAARRLRARGDRRRGGGGVRPAAARHWSPCGSGSPGRRGGRRG